MKTLLCFGDSNTYGTPPMRALGEWGRFGPAERWPGVVRGRLGPGWLVAEEGLPGRTTLHDDPIEGAHKNGLRVLPALLETHRPIDLMTLMLGTNDLKVRFGVPAEDIALSVERLVEAVKASPAGPDGRAPAVLLIAPVPIREAGVFAAMFRGGAATSRRLGGLLEEVAGRLGTGFLDAGALVETDPDEGIHLAADQHERLGQAVHAWIAASGL